MATSEPIEFQKVRDFSNKLNVTFEFVSQNFKSLTRCLLYLVGPPALVTSLLFGSVFGDYMKAVMGMAGPGGQEAFTNFLTSINFWLAVGLALIVATITGVMMTATVNNFVILYREKQGTNIEVEEVWDRVKKTFGMYFSTLIGYVFVAIAAYIVFLIPVVAFVAVSPVIVFFLALAFIVGIIYLFIATSLVFTVRGFETQSFFGSLSRSMFLVRGKWWSTFGLTMVFSIIVSTISSVFIIPWYVMFIITTLHNVERGMSSMPGESNSMLTIISFSLYYLVYYVLGSLPQLALIFQYFNLVERKESRGLMEKMGDLGTGNQPPPPPQTEHY